MSQEHLIKWKSDYPGDPSGDNLVFISEIGVLPTRAALNKTLKVLAKRSGIEKHFTPHVLKHSRITHLIQQGVNESVIKLMMWGSIDSKMFSTYAHLTGYTLQGLLPPGSDDEVQPVSDHSRHY